MRSSLRCGVCSDTSAPRGLPHRAHVDAEVGQAPDLFVPLAMESAVSSVPFKRWNAADRAWLVVLGRRRPGVADARVAATGMGGGGSP